MIDATRLLRDLQRLRGELEEDLRERVEGSAEIERGLREQHAAGRAAGRIGEAFEDWLAETLTQVAVAWILGCVFVRFVEDNGLIETPLLSGPGERRRRALDQHELYFRAPERRAHSDRDYLLQVFAQMRSLPAMADLFDPRHNPIWELGPSGDGASRLREFWQRLEPDSGALAHDFTDPEWDTRFLGDLYQELSERARKRYALLQTPEFVEELILDRTLTPAIEEFGFREVRLIDPACGSGHFLLGAFRRLFALWVAHEPGANPRGLAQRALAQVCGVDLNPYAVAIARFRLLVAALRASEIGSLRPEEAPAFAIELAAGDSLLHGRRFAELDLGSGAAQLRGRAGIGHAFFAEDLEALERILGRQYPVVVGNPPYITVKDRALSQLYRARYSTCHRKYALAVPFTERFFELARPAAGRQAAGFVGLITANSFMKREFCRKLVEEFLPRVDLTHVVDTSGAYIPDHGTPTVILLGRHRRPVADTVRTVMGIKGEPSTPQDPGRGRVWSAIVDQLDRPGSEGEFVSVADAHRAGFAEHPWSIGGGGAAELKECIEAKAVRSLGDSSVSIGFASFTGTDDVFVAEPVALLRDRIAPSHIRQFVYGEVVRDWAEEIDRAAFVPYDGDLVPIPLDANSTWGRRLWGFRSTLGGVKSFGGKTRTQCGDDWWTWYRWVPDKYRTPLSITFAEVATHNHFVLDRGGKVFNRTAPVIKLPAGASEDDHLALLGLLNSSTACFWLKQVCHNKGSTVDSRGARQTTDAFENFFQYNGTKVGKFPVAAEKPLELARALDALARERQAHLPAQLAGSLPLSRAELDAHRAEAERLLGRMIALQEELDWRCYRIHGVIDRELCYRDEAGRPLDPPEVRLGERAFEIVMARRMARGELETTWFERHRSRPLTEVPARWPAEFRA